MLGPLKKLIYPFIYCHSSVRECMPLQDIITAQSVSPDVRKDGSERLMPGFSKVEISVR